MGLSLPSLSQPIVEIPTIINPQGGQISQEPVSLLIDTGDTLLGYNDIDIEDGDTVASVLSKLADGGKNFSFTSQTYEGLGIFIDSINGVKGGDNNKYWQYWVNNQYGQIAADQYELKGGDVIMWKLTSSQYKDE